MSNRLRLHGWPSSWWWPPGRRYLGSTALLRPGGQSHVADRAYAHGQVEPGTSLALEVGSDLLIYYYVLLCGIDCFFFKEIL